jgi:hypothetical protein
MESVSCYARLLCGAMRCCRRGVVVTEPASHKSDHSTCERENRERDFNRESREREISTERVEREREISTERERFQQRERDFNREREISTEIVGTRR